MSDSLFSMIRKSEGLRTDVYDDIAGFSTIGYGHKIEANDPVLFRVTGQTRPQNITKEQADLILAEDVKRFQEGLKPVLPEGLNQNEIEAVTSLAFNIGEGAFKGSTLLKKLQEGDKFGAADEFLKWNKFTNPKTGQKEVSKGLANRRAQERNLFLNADGSIQVVKDPPGIFPQEIEQNRIPEPIPFQDSISAAFKRNSELGSIYNYIERNTLEEGQFDPSYNPLDDIKGYEPFADLFVDVPNKKSNDLLKQFLDEEIEREKIFDEADTLPSVLGMLGAEIFNPSFYLGGFLFKSGRLTSLMRSIDNSEKAVFESRRLGAIAGGTQVVQEGMLQPGNVTRTNEEAATNVLGTYVLGRLIGKLGAEKLGVKVNKAQDIESLKNNPLGIPQTDLGSVGAKAVGDDTGPVSKNGIFNFLFSKLKGLTPETRLVGSSSKTARKVGNKFFNSKIITEGDFVKVKTADDAANVELVFKELSNKVEGPIVDLKALSKSYNETNPNFRLTESNFMKSVGKGLYTNVNKAVSEVQQGVKLVRRQILELNRNLVKAGVLSKDFDVNTLPYLWDRSVIMRNVNQFEDDLLKSLKFDQSLEMAEKRTLVAEIRDSILGGEPDTLVSEILGQFPKIKFTSTNVSPKDLLPYTITNADEVLRSYSQFANRELAMKEVFPEGVARFRSDIQQEFSDLRTKTKSQKQIKKLLKEEKQVLQDIDALQEIFRGTYLKSNNPFSLSNRIPKAALTATYSVLGGMMGLTQGILESGRLLAVKNLTRIAGSEVAELGRKFTGTALTKKDLKILGAGLETELATRTLEIAELGGLKLHTTIFERGLERIARGVSIVSGLAPFTDLQTKIVARGFADEIILDVQKLSKGLGLDANRAALLNRYGINSSTAGEILEQFNKHKTIVDGISYANLDKWTGGRQFIRAVISETEAAIIRPGIATKPLAMHSKLGAMVGQFQSFPLALYNKFILPGIQLPDQKFLHQTSALLFLGSLHYLVREGLKHNGDLSKIDTRPVKVITEAVDRSSLLHLFFTPNHMLEKFTGVGIHDLLGVNSSRRIGGNPSQLLGPAFNLSSRAASSLSNIITGEGTKGDLTRIGRSITPMITLPGGLSLLEYVAENSGLPDRRDRR